MKQDLETRLGQMSRDRLTKVIYFCQDYGDRILKEHRGRAYTNHLDRGGLDARALSRLSFIDLVLFDASRAILRPNGITTAQAALE